MESNPDAVEYSAEYREPVVAIWQGVAMSNLEVKARPVSTSVHPPSLLPDWVTEPRTAPEVIIRKKTQRQAIKPTIHYPESDGMPMAESTVQYKSLTNIEGNVSILYRDDPNVFVAADLFWYPLEGYNDIKYAPDIMVVFGRSKKDRGSYKQWEEDNIAPQVIFEIWSPGNTQESKEKKFKFYDLYGVEEYYTYDPNKGEMEGWLRKDGSLQKISKLDGWRSPRLGIQFRLKQGPNGRKRMQLYYPDGRPFLSRIEEFEAREAAEAKAQVAETKTQIAETKAQASETKAQTEAAARAEAEAEVEQTKALLKAAMEQLQKAGISLPDDAS